MLWNKLIGATTVNTSPPVFIGVATASGASSASVTPHANTQAGDLLVAIFHFKDTDTTYSVTFPSGFNEVFNKIVASGGGYSVIAVATKVASGSDGAQSFSWTGYSNAGVSIVTVRNQLSTNPVTVFGSVISVASATTINVASISPTKQSLLLGIVNGFDSSKTWTPPVTMTEAYDFSAGSTGGLRCSVAYETLTSSGATGTRTFTFSGTSDNISGILVAVE